MKDCCPICLDTYSKNKIKNNIIKLECGHVFHKQCILEWVKINPICALCRKYFTSRFRIYKTKHMFFRKFAMIEITDQCIEIYSINTNKMIINPLLYLDVFKQKEDIFGNNIVAKTELLGDKIISIKIKQITKLFYSFNVKQIVLYYTINGVAKIYKFKCEKNKIPLIFNILKKNIETIRNLV